MACSGVCRSVMAAAIVSAAGSALGADVQWARAMSGLWSDPLNWVQARVPTPSDAVRIDPAGIYAVQMDEDALIQSLTIADGPTLELLAGRSLLLLGDLHNDGAMHINPDGIDADTGLSFFYNNASITGAGTLRLGGFGNDARLELPDGFMFTNGPGHTIAGGGRIDASINNLGRIVADSGTLSLNGIDRVVNSGTLEARDDSLLSCTIQEIDQTGGGSIVANGLGSRVAIGHTADITGGTIRAEDRALVTKSRGSLIGVDIDAADEGSSIRISDGVISGGVIRAHPDASVRIEDCFLQSVDIQTPIEVDNTVTLSGEISRDLVFLGRVFDEVLLRHDVVIDQPVTISMPEGGTLRVAENGNPTVISPNLTLRSSVDFYFGGVNYATVILEQGQSAGLNFGELFNQGDISANQDASVSFDGCLVTNGGKILIDDGSTLRITDATLIRQPGGDILAERNSIVEIEDSLLLSGFHLNLGTDATVKRTTIQLDPGEELYADRYGTTLILEDSEVTGGLVRMFGGALLEPARTSIEHLVLDNGQLEAGPAFEITGSLTNNGEIRLAHRDLDAMVVPDGMSILGEGEILFEGAGQLVSRTGGPISLGVGQSVSGIGEIPVPLVNHGMIGSGVIVSGGSFANTGQVSSGGTQPAVIRSLQVTQSSEGRIEAIAPGATVRLAGTDLSGGTIATSNGGMIRVEELSRFDDVQMSGQFEVFRGAQLTLASGAMFQGTMRINPGNGSGATSLAWDPEHPPALSGVVALEGTPERAWISSSGAAQMPLTIPGDLRVEGIGLIDASCLIEGEIAPGLALGLGTLSANGVMQFAPDASLRISVDAVGADALVSASQVELAGTLVVEPLGLDMLPDGYWTHQIVFAPSITGGFDAIEALGIAEGRAVRVKQEGPILSIVHTCVSDFDLDGEQDFFDVSAFIDAYNAGDPGADIQGDGLINFFDVSAFLIAYQGGCAL